MANDIRGHKSENITIPGNSRLKVKETQTKTNKKKKKHINKVTCLKYKKRPEILLQILSAVQNGEELSSNLTAWQKINSALIFITYTS